MIKLSETNRFIEVMENLYDAIFYGVSSSNSKGIILMEKEVPLYSEIEMNNFKFSIDEAEKKISALESIRFKTKKEKNEIESQKNIIKNNQEKIRSTKRVKVDVYTPAKIQAANDIIDEISKLNSIPFDDLWDYAQLLRWAEKVLFYKNDIVNYIYSDSELHSDENRNFMIQTDDYIIIFNLEKQEVSVLDTFSNNEFIDVIKIEIRRKFGKELTNTFIIIDRNVKYEDDSDLYLINTINLLLREAIVTSFTQIKDMIINKSFIKLTKVLNGKNNE